MADPADQTPHKGENRPSLALHVPEPKFRPGDVADFSDIDIGKPGDQPRPDEATKPADMKDLAYGLVRVLGEDNKAHGPWDPKLDAETLRNAGSIDLEVADGVDERLEVVGYGDADRSTRDAELPRGDAGRHVDSVERQLRLMGEIDAQASVPVVGQPASLTS